MARAILTIALFSTLALASGAAADSAEDDRIHVSGFGMVGGGGGAIGWLAGAQAEFALPAGFSAGPTVFYYGYHWEDGSEEEDGYGIGPGGIVRWYASREAFRGFFVEAGGTVLFGSWEYENEDFPVDNEEDDEVAGEFHGRLGWVFRVGPHFTITPSVIAGNYITTAEEGGGFYSGVGVELGFAF